MKIKTKLLSTFLFCVVVISQAGYINAQEPQAQVKKNAVAQQFKVPVVTIGGNTGPVDLGELVLLTADLPDNLPDGLVEISYKWTVLDNGQQKRVIVVDGGKEIGFAAGTKPRKILVILTVNCLYETKQTIKVLGADGKTQEDKLVITDASAISPSPVFSTVVVGNGPEPTPTPTPVPPEPTPVPVPPTPVPVPPAPPVLPEGKFGLAPFAYKSFMADTSLDMPSKIKLANSLADNLTGIAAQIAAIPTYNDIATILADTKRGNDAAFAGLGLDMSKTANLQALFRSKIYELYKNQKINTASDISSAWVEMSGGLRAVK